MCCVCNKDNDDSRYVTSLARPQTTSYHISLFLIAVASNVAALTALAAHGRIGALASNVTRLAAVTAGALVLALAGNVAGLTAVAAHGLVGAVASDVAHLVAATREHPMLDLGISPRGTIALTRMAKASAYIKGRNYVVPTDVSDVFKEVAVHRLQLSAKARVNHVTAEGIISTILESVPQPLPEKRQG